MANGFGPATAGVEQAVLALLQGRQASPVAPVPLAPTGGIGPLDMDTTAALAALQPQPVPPALPPPVDADAIRSRFAGLAGPEPTAPPVEPAALIVRIARALQGFGAGVQGQGPQYLAQLAEERNRPQREFRAQKERFDTRKQELGVLGEQAVLSAEDRRAQRTQQLLDKQADREFEASVKRSGIQSQQAIERMREAFNLERDAKKAELERLEQERKDAKDRKAAITTLANTFTDDFRINREQARRFAQFEIDGTPLSAADAKRYSRIEKYRPSTGGAAGGGTGSKVMVEIQNDDGSMSIVPFTSVVASGINSGNLTQGPRGVFIEGQPTGAKPAPTIPSPFPEFSGGLLPTPSFMNQQPSAPTGQVFTRAQVQAHAKKTGRDPAAIEADLRARGFTVQ
jgi:hypothetical protein